MADKFDFSQAVQQIIDSKKTGHWQIRTESVKWDLYWQEGKILYAQHSLQSLETLTYHLMRISPAAMAKLPTNLVVDKNNHFRLLPIVRRIYDSKIISHTEKLFLVKEISQDALESLICLSHCESEWLTTNTTYLEELKTTVGDNLFEAKSLLRLCQIRLQQWEKLYPIVSPHQRPILINPSLFINNPTVEGVTLSPAVLAQLAKLMKGLSIRQLSFLLKQDELKFAQLLYPYVEQGIITINPPKAPLDELPTPLSRHEKPSASTSTSVPVLQLVATEPLQTRERQEKATLTSLSHRSEKVEEQSKPAEDIEIEGKYKVVCIDDSPTALQTMRKYLTEEGFEVVTVDNPMRSVSCLFQTKPDLILMDLSMPGINGNRLSKILKSSSAFKDVPIVVVSGNASALTPVQLEEMGGKDFLAKPFKKEDLLRVVKRCLAKRFSTPIAAVKSA
ncbi:MAG TPA: response regulator [Geminocystis sp. M7585_C2015_104]|nr:response regulator [Geminocystis sp. M7585_C2015_104]